MIYTNLCDHLAEICMERRFGDIIIFLYATFWISGTSEIG